MNNKVHHVVGGTERWGIAGLIAAKITCLVGMHLSVLLGVLGASAASLPVLDPINRVLGPISLPLFLVSLSLTALGAFRRGPIALALVLGGGLLLYAAAFKHGMNLPLYGLAMAMLLGPFVVQPVWSSFRHHRTPMNDTHVVGGLNE